MKKDTKSKGLKRRDFLKTVGTTAAVAGLSAGPFSIISRRLRASNLLDDPRVVVVRDGNAHSGSQVVGDIVQVMMDEAIRRYTGITDIGAAYMSVFPGIITSSVIGIKVNCLYTLCTHPIVVDALINGLLRMTPGGSPFPANNIIIWDNTSSRLQSGGYTINTGSNGVRCFGTNVVGYNSMYLDCNGSNQHPSNILTDYCDYLVDFAVLKNHSISGVTLSMKNHLGSIDYPGGLHGNHCNPYIPALNQQIRDVLSVQETLHIVDAIFGVYYGGPGGSPNMVYDGIILGEDRVAVDAIGRQILDDTGCTTIGISDHVDTAAGSPYFLGTADLAGIDRVEIQNPSAAVTNLVIKPAGQDVVLRWDAPEYTGLVTVQRSTDSSFTTYDEIATVNGDSYTDAGVLGSSNTYFYRVVKTW
jgi:uncharacterized protein (DUF362 family)